MLFKKKKKTNKPIIKDCIADMHTNGLRFSEKEIKKIRENKEKLYCSYSGLPSIHSYE